MIRFIFVAPKLSIDETRPSPKKAKASKTKSQTKKGTTIPSKVINMFISLYTSMILKYFLCPSQKIQTIPELKHSPPMSINNELDSLSSDTFLSIRSDGLSISSRSSEYDFWENHFFPPITDKQRESTEEIVNQYETNSISLRLFQLFNRRFRIFK